MEAQFEGRPRGRWIAFQAKAPLPADSDVTVTIGPGTPSAEGPLVTKEAQAYSFHTFAPLKIEDHGCYYGNNQCVPLAPLFIRFNNPLDPVRARFVHGDDPPKSPALMSTWGTIQIQGASKGQTTYTVTVSGRHPGYFRAAARPGYAPHLQGRAGRASPLRPRRGLCYPRPGGK